MEGEGLVAINPHQRKDRGSQAQNDSADTVVASSALASPISGSRPATASTMMMSRPIVRCLHGMRCDSGQMASHADSQIHLRSTCGRDMTCQTNAYLEAIMHSQVSLTMNSREHVSCIESISCRC